jgi:crotonobetainyl-CoA:carnitine CoA-transferase CaiB-like acyl-CoA transferase
MIWAEGEPKDIGRDMRSGGITGIHPTREGYLYISANTPHFWQALCEKTGLDALASNERYDSVRKRALHCDEIVPQLHAALAARSALEWEALFGDAVPCAAARGIEDMFDDPQVLAEDMVATYTYPGVGHYRGFRQPIRFGDTTGPTPLAAPAFGQHSDAVLRESGWSDDGIAALRAKRAVL